MGLAQFRTTEAEEEVIAARMVAAGDANRTEHFRRVYFQSAGIYESIIGELREENRGLAKQVQEVRTLLYRMAERESSDLEMRMMAALMVMIYPSVDERVRAKVDKHIDMRTIEMFLNGNEKEKR